MSTPGMNGGMKNDANDDSIDNGIRRRIHIPLLRQALSLCWDSFRELYPL
jgi:hypothetical protein